MTHIITGKQEPNPHQFDVVLVSVRSVCMVCNQMVEGREPLSIRQIVFAKDSNALMLAAVLKASQLVSDHPCPGKPVNEPITLEPPPAPDRSILN